MNKELITVTSINGKLVKRGEDKISVFDNSLLYAEGLFETVLSIDNKLIYLEEHLDRLWRGAKIMGWEIPVSREQLKDWMNLTVSEHPDKIQKLRLTVTSGEAARWVGVQGEKQIILSASPHTMPSHGFKLHVAEFKIDQDSIFRRIKTLSYAIHAAALNQAKKAGCDDALLLNEKDEIAEVTSANIFWVQNKQIYTPPLSAGCLEGITRMTVTEEAKNLGYKVIEKEGNLKSLFDAEEVFISSSLKLVVGVAEIVEGDKSYQLNTGQITTQMGQHFSQLVGLS